MTLTWWEESDMSMHDTSWMSAAVCGQTDPRLFFPGKGEVDRLNTAKRLCRTCAAQEECLAWALAQPGISGILGGTTKREREALQRRARAAA